MIYCSWSLITFWIADLDLGPRSKILSDLDHRKLTIFSIYPLEDSDLLSRDGNDQNLVANFLKENDRLTGYITGYAIGKSNWMYNLEQIISLSNDCAITKHV